MNDVSIFLVSHISKCTLLIQCTKTWTVGVGSYEKTWTVGVGSYEKTWTVGVGSYGKTWTVSVGSYGKTWTVGVGSYGKTWTVRVGSYGKTWTASVGSYGKTRLLWKNIMITKKNEVKMKKTRIVCRKTCRLQEISLRNLDWEIRWEYD